jgi:peptidyl-prolyl cis-trans isomerase C
VSFLHPKRKRKEGTAGTFGKAWSVAAVGLLLLSFCGCTDRGSKGTVVAKVGDQVLTLEEIAVLTSPEGEVPVSFEDRREFIQQWIDTEVLYREALREKLHTDPKIKQALQQMEKELLAAELMERRIGNEMAISDREIEEYYQSHQDEYLLTQPLRQARHILLNSREQAEQARSRALRGEPFESLVVEMSIDSATHATGGDLGLFSQDDMVPEIAAVAFALEVNAISEPIQTEWGYHILQVTDAKPEGSVLPLGQVKGDIANKIFTTRQRLAFDSLMKELKQNEDIEVYWNLIQSDRSPDQPDQTKE